MITWGCSYSRLRLSGKRRPHSPHQLAGTRILFRKRQFSRTFSYCVFSTQHTFASGGQANETHSPFSPDLFTFTQLVRADASPRRGRAPHGGGSDARQAGES